MTQFCEITYTFLVSDGHKEYNVHCIYISTLNTCIHPWSWYCNHNFPQMCYFWQTEEWRFQLYPSVCAACLVRYVINFTSLANGWCHSSRGHWILCFPNLEFQLGGQFILSEYVLSNMRQRQPIIQINNFCVFSKTQVNKNGTYGIQRTTYSTIKNGDANNKIISAIIKCVQFSRGASFS